MEITLHIWLFNIITHMQHSLKILFFSDILKAFSFYKYHKYNMMEFMLFALALFVAYF